MLTMKSMVSLAGLHCMSLLGYICLSQSYGHSRMHCSSAQLHGVVTAEPLLSWRHTKLLLAQNETFAYKLTKKL